MWDFEYINSAKVRRVPNGYMITEEIKNIRGDISVSSIFIPDFYNVEAKIT